MGTGAAATGVDFSQGVRLDDIPRSGTLAGRVGDEPALLSRFDGELYAVSGACTHYGAPLAAGLLSGEAAYCPLHHACFDLKTGNARRGPALDPLKCWRVIVEGDAAFVREELVRTAAPAASSTVRRIVIVGGGAAGLSCANELRSLGYSGRITILSSDRDLPYDRPNLSKDYLAGTAPEEWMPLRTQSWFDENSIELRLGTRIVRIEAEQRVAHSESGDDFPFDRLLLATGSVPHRLDAPGFDRENVLTLRSFGDARAIGSHAGNGARAVVIGSSFIGLEAAAALRQRGVQVDVVSPEHVPFDHVLGPELGRFFQKLHEKHRVGFHLGVVASSFDGRNVQLVDGTSLPADFVVVGIGVRPCTELARSAGLPSEGGVPVNCYLETEAPGIFAAGDIASYPDPWRNGRARIEHWVTAGRQGQTVAANMLGLRRRYEALPFFWTEQYGVGLRYVGHAGCWDEVRIEGDVVSGDFTARYYERGVLRASASVGRDRQNLEDERTLEAQLIGELEKPLDAGTRIMSRHQSVRG